MQQCGDPVLCPVPRADPVVYNVRLATKISATVDRRLRMLALIKGRPLNHVLVSLLDQALPGVDELAALLAECTEEAVAS